MARGDEVDAFASVAAITDRVKYNGTGGNADRIGICMDTCHVSDGGYDIINHPYLKTLPMILETPNDLDGYAREINLLRSLEKLNPIASTYWEISDNEQQTQSFNSKNNAFSDGLPQ